ncbi:MAG: hypothetical protein Q4F79_07455 [Eubacteriales bacterium]|nr:hypothetical protein [Eubacteriales bacterium]
MATTTKSTLADLVRKKAQMDERPKNFDITVGGITLTFDAVPEDELFEWLSAVKSDKLDDTAAVMKTMYQQTKQMAYLHCTLLQEYAGQNPPEGEPWDVLEELFDVAERNELYGAIMDATGITKMLNGQTKNG